MSNTGMIRAPTSARGSMSRRVELVAWAAGVSLLVAGCGYNASVYGLRPLSPTVRVGAMFGGSNGQLVYPVVDFARPTFEWEAFVPSEIPASSTGPTSITYDLRIWKVHKGSPGELVYERKALPTPQHELQKPLEPETRYFWSVRTRFELGGETRLTDWSRAVQPYNPVIRTDLPSPIPAANYFRFVTSGH